MKRKPKEGAACREIFAALSEYLDGTLPARNCRELRRHLKGCKPCIAYLDTLQKTIRTCQLYSAPAAPPPSPAVRDALRHALLQGPTAPESPVDSA